MCSVDSREVPEVCYTVTVNLRKNGLGPRAHFFHGKQVDQPNM